MPALIEWRGAGALLLLLLLSGCSWNRNAADGTPAGPDTVAVRVTFREASLPGARVEFRRSPAEAGESPVAAGSGNRDGTAVFDLPPGRYFLVGRWRADGDYSRPIRVGDRHAYFGGNPVFLDGRGPREIFLGLEEFASPPGSVGEPAGGTGVAGRVLTAGTPVESAIVFAYHRTESAFRDLGFAASAPTSQDGSFVLELPPGSYHLLVRKRAAGGIAGPMRKGDLFGYYPANPVVVSTGGGYARVTIPATRLKLRNAPAYSDRSRAAAFVEGRILGSDGRPRAGVYAALYDNPDLLNRPVFLSDVTGDDGRYRLPVPVPGEYYLGARSGYGGSPAPGDLYGRYEKNAQHSLTVREGDRLSGVDITVNEVW